MAMISEKQLAAWERHYKAGSISKYRYETEHMPALIAEVRRLRAELTVIEDHNESRLECIDEKGKLKNEVRQLRAELDKVSDERSDFGVIGYFQGASDAHDRIRQLEKEAHWLAVQCDKYNFFYAKKMGIKKREYNSPQKWRVAAREAVESK